MKIISCLTIVVFILGGCATPRTISLSQSPVEDRISFREMIDSGDHVRITTNDGVKYDFKVTSITDEYIKGKDVEISVKDIKQVEKYEFSGIKTIGLVGESVIVTIGVIGLVAIAAFIGVISKSF
jgi:hypothetical protein